MKQILKGWRERGLSLIEVSLALCLGAVVLVGVITYATAVQHKTKLHNQAQQLAPWVQAGTAYTVAHRRQWIKEADTLLPSVADGYVRSLPPVTVADLQGQKFIPSSVSTQLLSKQQPELRVRLIKQSALVDKWRIEALLYTKGGEALPDDDLGFLVADMGAQSGRVTAVANSVIQGANGSWRASVADWGGAVLPGHLAWLLNVGDRGVGSTDAWLSRAAAPDPDQNKMEADLVLANNAVTGAACGTTAALNSDRNGEPLYCVEGKWTSGAQLVNLNGANVEQVTRDRVVTRHVDRGTLLTAQAGLSDSNTPVIIYYGCSAVIELSENGKNNWITVSESSQRITSVATSNKGARCNARGYVPHGWWYRVSLNKGYASMNDTTITTYSAN